MSNLNTFLFGQTQIQRVNLTRNSNHANPFFERQLAGLTASFHATGFSSLEASKKAMAQVSAMVDRQGTVLAYVNAFWLMMVLVGCLVPLVSVWKKPTPEEEASSAEAH
jgi:DHA2 family multidrug resistance protein